MSEIQTDKEVLNEGRRNPLKGAEAPLRDQIVKKLYDKCVELNIPSKVDSMVVGGNASRSMWLERQKLYLQDWDEHLIGDTEGPFSGSSNLHIPLTFTVCKTLHARFMQALWQTPPFHAKANNEASLDRLGVVKDILNYYLFRGANYHQGAGKTVDQWVWDWVTAGSGIMKLRWDVTYSRFVDVETAMEPGAPKFVAAPDGSEIAVPTLKPVEKEITRTKRCFEGPVFDIVNPEDLLIIGGQGNPDLADAVIHEQFLTASELWTLVDRKIFDEEAVEKIINGGPDYVDGSVGGEIKQLRAQNAGQSRIDSEYDLDRYAISEAYLKVDVDGSGINSDVVVWVHRKSRTLLRATYLYRINKSGERPFVKADFQLRKGQEYGTGMVELLYPLAKEMDAMHNMRVDFGLISVMPFGFYRPSSGINPETIKFEPGTLIPVDNPGTDVFFPNLGNRTVFGFQEEQSLQTMVERLTSISDLNLGLMSGQGATRTATGARALVGEMSSNLDVYLRRLNFGWEKALRCLLHTLQQRIPAGLSFRVTGEDGADYWRWIRGQDDIAGDFDIEVSPNSATSNSGIQQEVAQQILQITSNPLDIQLGVITPAQRYEALKNYMQALGVKDYGRYLQRPQMATRVFTPEEEAGRLLRGIPVQVTPEADHEGFIAYVEQIKGDDMLLGQFSTEQFMALEAQARQHAQMMQALAEMQAQQANASQMRSNAQMSQQQVPQGMGPMAGAMNAQGASAGGQV